MSWYRRLLNLLRSDQVAHDIDREIDFHLAERVDELIARGMTEAEARHEARRRFGHRQTLKERVYDIDVLAWLDSVIADLRYAIRALRANPGFTAVAVLSLGLGIGANTAIFSLINAVMLRSLPVSHPEEIVQLTMGEGGTSFTNPQWEQIRERQEALAGAFAFSDASFNLTTGGPVRRAPGAWVSGDYFNVLGVSAAAGRVLQPADDVRGCPGVAVLSHSFWQREYGGAADAIGRTISLSGHPFEIVGVTAPGFAGIHVGRSAGVFVPICTIDILREGRGILDARSTWFLNVFGRLPTGASLAEARAALVAVAPVVFESTTPPQYSAREQARYRERTLEAAPAANGLSYVRGQYRDALFALLMVVGVVLLIACANVAQLLLARATARQDEIAVRLAMGSGRVRLARQLLTESVLLALLGAAVGAFFARRSSGIIVGFLSQGGRAVSLDLSLDLRVLAFTIAVATATGVLFGFAPAWRSTRVDPQMAMRGAGRGQLGDSRQRFAKGIVVGQVALSLVLVMAASLLVGSFQRLATLDPGFRPEGVLVVSADWSNLDLSADRERHLPRELLERMRAVPGVRDAGASLITPISGTSWNDDVVVDGVPADEPVWFNGVSDGYMRTLGTDLLAGRDFTPQDKAAAAPVVLVNQSLAQRFFGEASPLGKSISKSLHDSIGPPMEIVGVVEDAKYRRLDEPTLATVYVPFEQTESWRPSVDLALRCEGAPKALIPAVTEVMREIHPAIAVEFTALHDQLATSLARPRLLALLSGFFGGLALLLAVIGLYGTMSYSVARRRSEIGIRIALGSARTGILRMVAGEAGALVAIGVGLGALLALAATRLVAAFLYGVRASDPLTLALSALLLATVAIAAGLVPAWRAAGVDPMITLREE
ncbi:MAG: ABC transporter permease [Gemmatimonadales bacterium]|jgi:predicted permease